MGNKLDYQREPHGSVKRAIQGIIPSLETGRLYTTKEIAELAGKRHGSVGPCLRRYHIGMGLGFVGLDHHFWIVPESVEEAEIIVLPCGHSEYAEHWAWIGDFIDRNGFAPKPAYLMSRNERPLESVRTQGRATSRINTERLWGYARNGDDAFDLYVEISGLPTSDLDGQTAIVYRTSRILRE